MFLNKEVLINLGGRILLPILYEAVSFSPINLAKLGLCYGCLFAWFRL